VLRTASGKIELCAEPLVADIGRLQEAGQQAAPTLVLIGRRQLRSNNSWMHNVPVLVKGKERCTLHVHPDDAGRLSLRHGGLAEVASRAGSLVAPVEVTEDVMPGVVSLPHGWGHGIEGTWMQVAATHAGVNSNVLADESVIDPLSGNAVFNGIPVDVRPA
jgi:anaerobic selenocysteine-containing dehydrogenase